MHSTIKLVSDEAKADTPGFAQSAQAAKEAPPPSEYTEYETRMTASQLRGLVTGAQVHARRRLTRTRTRDPEPESEPEPELEPEPKPEPEPYLEP